VVIVDGPSGEVTIDPDADDLRATATACASWRAGSAARPPAQQAQPHPRRRGYHPAGQRRIAGRRPRACAGRRRLGLYRTEFLFLQRDTLPDEEEQFRLPRCGAGHGGRPVTIRTLDLGADKADRAGLAATGEENPALGLRGIRLSLAHPKVADAAARLPARLRLRPVRMLVPMVTSREEILGVAGASRGWPASCARKATRSPTRAAGRDDRSAGRRHRRAPSSTGRLHVDRHQRPGAVPAGRRPQQRGLGELYSPLHPGGAAPAAHDRRRRAHGTPVAVCGEMAGDAAMTPLLLALGLTEFSLHPANLLEVRQAIRDTDLAPCARTPELLKARDRRASSAGEARSAAALTGLGKTHGCHFPTCFRR
jgi:phosphotransferase system enzyme I (PtsI)